MFIRLSLMTLLGTAALATPTPTADSYKIDSLFASSDAVCAGTLRIMSSRPALEQPGIREAGLVISREAQFTISRCYKGLVSASDRIRYSSHVPAIVEISPPEGRTILLFLKRTNPDTFTFADEFWGWLHDASLVIHDSVRHADLARLERDLLVSLREDRGPEARVGNLRVLHGFSTLQETTRAEITKDVHPLVAVAAFAVLIKAGRADDLATFCKYLGAVDPGALSHVGLSFTFYSLTTLRSPDSRPGLECLARTTIAPLSHSAMDGIRGMRNSASIPELIHHLDDDDPFMQYQAVITLSEIAPRRELPGPGMAEFERDPGKYAASWKAWWSARPHGH
ncbi:MAG TPA: hypothetical protein VKU19_08550 [Bryobacteraceae bacterium]|nr:hypothetical protein [Bryobacteraceae bacterium]